MKRASGLLLHITSLPSPYGVGTLGKAAYDFVRFNIGMEIENFKPFLVFSAVICP